MFTRDACDVCNCCDDDCFDWRDIHGFTRIHTTVGLKVNRSQTQIVHCSLSKQFLNCQLFYGMYRTHLVFGAIPKFKKQALLSHWMNGTVSTSIIKKSSCLKEDCTQLILQRTREWSSVSVNARRSNFCICEVQPLGDLASDCFRSVAQKNLSSLRTQNSAIIFQHRTCLISKPCGDPTLSFLHNSEWVLLKLSFDHRNGEMWRGLHLMLLASVFNKCSPRDRILPLRRESVWEKWISGRTFSWLQRGLTTLTSKRFLRLSLSATDPGHILHRIANETAI